MKQSYGVQQNTLAARATVIGKGGLDRIEIDGFPSVEALQSFEEETAGVLEHRQAALKDWSLFLEMYSV